MLTALLVIFGIAALTMFLSGIILAFSILAKVAMVAFLLFIGWVVLKVMFQ